MAVRSDVLRAGTGGVPLTRKRESLWADAFRRLLRNRAAVVGGVPVIAPYSYQEQVLPDNNVVPAWVVKVFPFMAGYARISDNYAFGADYVGRDIMSRAIYGARVSLTVALVAPLISLFIGVIFGSIAGFFGGRVDNLMMRVVDVLYAFPTLLFIILLMAFFRGTYAHPEPGSFTYIMSSLDQKMGGMLFIFIGIGVTAWETMARLTRGQVLSVREKEFVEAARTVGSGNRRIMARHVLPNIIGVLIVYETLAIPAYIATEAFLSFIGLGVNPPTPSWGIMVANSASAVRTQPNQVLLPALMLAITMFAFNFLGDGLRDALAPRLRGTQ